MSFNKNNNQFSEVRSILSTQESILLSDLLASYLHTQINMFA